MSPATCPQNVPVVALPPQQVAGFSWGSVIRPQNDPCVSHIVVDPANDSDWYVGGWNGLYVTKNAGQTWTKPLNGQVNFPSLAGGSWAFHSFGPDQTGLLVWTLSHDPLSGNLYAGTEIYDHPLSGQPPKYRPPFFRSTNGGQTWTNVNPNAVLQTHATASAVRPSDGYVYALTEGEGLFGSSDHGNTWQPPLPVTSPGPTVGLRMDPQHPKHLFAGQQKTSQPFMKGGIFVSVNAGLTFHPIGLTGVTVGSVALSAASNRLYAACYGSGIYVSPIPASISP
jgi:hypothetical protein